MQYTIRNIPKELDAGLRNRAKLAGISLNQAVIRVLEEALELEHIAPERDLSDVVGSWVDDPVAEGALADQRGIDEELWK